LPDLNKHTYSIYRGKKKNGFFIEAGAYDGEMYSNSLYFELKHQVSRLRVNIWVSSSKFELFQWSGLLIEPSPRHFNQLLLKNR